MSLIGQSVTIIGAGVAGLAAARALALRGASVTVLEQADAIREVGAGLQISPNGACVLRALGLQEALEAASTRAKAVQLIDGPTGDPVTRLDLARLRPGQGYHFLHRADLIALLLKGAEEAGVTLRLLSRIDSVDLSGARPAVTLDTGERIETPLLIGADGLHSKTRAALNGPEHAVLYPSGRLARRDPLRSRSRSGSRGPHGTGPPSRQLPPARRHLAQHRRCRGTPEMGRGKLDTPRRSDGPAPRLREFFAPRPWLAGQGRGSLALGSLPPQGCPDLGPKPMGQGGAVILGDAAHPTLPFLAQGASMGLEDAWVLTDSLARHDTAAAALAAYQATRKPRTTRIVAAANANARAYHLSGLPRMIGHTGLRLLGRLSPGSMLSRFDWLYDHDVTLG
jgi:salicylate hydroxylase